MKSRRRNSHVSLFRRRAAQASLIFISSCLLLFLFHDSLLKLMRFSSQLPPKSTPSDPAASGTLSNSLRLSLTVGCLVSFFQKLTWKTKDVEKCTVRGKNSVSIRLPDARASSAPCLCHLCLGPRPPVVAGGRRGVARRSARNHVPGARSDAGLFLCFSDPTGRVLQLHQSAGAAQRRDALRLRHQRLQPHLPQLQGERAAAGHSGASGGVRPAGY